MSPSAHGSMPVNIVSENKRFRRRIDPTEQIEFPSSSICLAVCEAGASSACLLVTKLALMELYFYLIICHILI